MPTAVENLANVLRNALKLDLMDGSVAQGAFARADAQIDDGFAALNAAATPRALAAAERAYAGAFEGVGADLWGGGVGVAKDAMVFAAVAEVWGGGGGSGTPADFVAFDRQLFQAGADLAHFGADVAALGHVGSHNELIGLLRTLNVEAGHLQSEFHTLGGEVATLVSDLTGGANGDGVSHTPYSGLAAAFAPLASQFSQIGDDFADIFGGGGGSGRGADIFGGGGGSGRPSSAFASLNHDLLAVDGSMQGLGAPIAGLLLPAVRPVG